MFQRTQVFIYELKTMIFFIEFIFKLWILIFIHIKRVMAETRIAQQNLSTIVCYTSPQYIVLIKNYTKYKKNSDKQMLVINRNDNKITCQTKFNTNKFFKRAFSAFLGIATIQDERFAVFCDEVKVACTVNKFAIFQIQSLFFLSFKDQKIVKRLDTRKQIFGKIRDLNVLLTIGFYFSHQYNLTRTLQYQSHDSIRHFIWNNVFLRPLQKFPEWQTPIIQGYVSFFQIFIQGTKIYYILISRRSLKKGGTRYFDRGINDEGYVANFVELQQIVKINQFLMSDLQIRGTVPLFFEQKGLTTKIKLTRGYELTHQIYEKNISKMIASYERVFWVNLLNQQKRGELVLINELERHIKEDNNKNLKYFYYDFHKATGHKDFQKVDAGIEQVKDIKKGLRFYLYDSKKDEVIMRQWGVFRTNCLDSLDRTNFFQTKVAMITFQQMLANFQIVFQKSMLKLMNDPSEQSSQIVNFRTIWANNGDAISYHYTGTGSTHTDVIRDGQRGFLGIFKHKYKSVARFYNQNFWDFYKMKLVDQLLNQKTSQMQTITIPALVNQRSAQFCQHLLLDIYLFTWKSPKKIPASIPLLPNTNDIIAISIQQLTDDDKWRKIVNEAIDQHKYILICQKISSHNLLMIYSKKQLKQAITNVQATKVKFKSIYNQYLSNKCAVIIRFLYYNTSITFIGCQLQFGRQYSSYRIDNLRDIHRYAFQQTTIGQKQSQPILQDDVIFLFGNMNTNISTSYKNTIVQQFSKNTQNLTLQQRRLITDIIQTDEFESIQQSLLRYRYYQQQSIKFAPTYKYLKSKYTFDAEVSGWPDRIWYSTQKKMICSKYGVIQQLRDQHVPVFANFQVEIEKINQQAKQAVSQEVFSRISQARGYIQSDTTNSQADIKNSTNGIN